MDLARPKGAGEGHGPGEGSAQGTSYLWWCFWWFWLLPAESPSGGRLGSSHLPHCLWSSVWESVLEVLAIWLWWERILTRKF